jgi:hypothetical protein
MKKVEIDITPWLGEEGVVSSLWFGNNGEPSYEETLPYNMLIDQTLESYTVRGVILEKDYDDAEDFVKALEAAAAYARTNLEEMSE